MEKKIAWYKKPLAFLFDSEWDLDPYKIAAFLLLWQFSAVATKVMSLIDEKADVGLIGIAAGLLLPITTMVTFLFNFSKENDHRLLDAAKGQ